MYKHSAERIKKRNKKVDMGQLSDEANANDDAMSVGGRGGSFGQTYHGE